MLNVDLEVVQTEDGWSWLYGLRIGTVNLQFNLLSLPLKIFILFFGAGAAEVVKSEDIRHVDPNIHVSAEERFFSSNLVIRPCCSYNNKGRVMSDQN